MSSATPRGSNGATTSLDAVVRWGRPGPPLRNDAGSSTAGSVILHVVPDEARLREMLELGAFGGIGIILAVGLLIAAGLLLSKPVRPLLKVPLFLLLAHLGVLLFERFALSDDHPLRRPLFVVAVALLLFSMGRSSFLLIVNALVGRRGQVPLPRIIQDILQGIIYVAVTLVVLRSTGVDPTSILTTSALLTAVVGLSLQETLGNLFAGLALQAQRPFEVGDWIQFDPDAQNTGRVVEINWRATRVITNDNVEIIVPNGALARASIRNFSKPTTDLRRSVTITVAGSMSPTEVRAMIMDALQDVPSVLAQPRPDVLTIGFGERGMEYRVRFWTQEFERREPIDSAVRERLWFALQRAGHVVPLPAREVIMETTQEDRAKDLSQRALELEGTLRGVDFLRDLPAEALQQIAFGARRRMFDNNEVVIREGTTGTELFVIEDGEVEIIVRREKGEPARVATLGTGKFFGEMSLMTGEPRRATVRTLRPSNLIVVDKAALATVLESFPQLAQRISNLLAEREVALGQIQSKNDTDRKSIVDMRSDALLRRIRDFFAL